MKKIQKMRRITKKRTAQKIKTKPKMKAVPKKVYNHKNEDSPTIEDNHKMKTTAK